MISLTQIQRMIDHGSFAQLIRRVLSNGRCTCPAIREHLLSSANGPDTPIAACGFALQRCCELSYMPTDLAADLARRLTSAQMPDGRFGIADDTSLACTAIALRGLFDYREQLRDAGEASLSGEMVSAIPDLDDRIDRGLAALSHMVNVETAEVSHAIGTAIAVWQLGHLPSFRRSIDVDRVLGRLRDHHSHELDTRLVDYAYAQAA